MLWNIADENELLAPRSPNLNSEKEIGEYCESLLARIWDDDCWNQNLDKSINVLKKIIKSWGETRGENYLRGIKDSAEFSEYLLKNIDINCSDACDNAQFRGKIIAVSNNPQGKQYGFISRTPTNIFFHQSNSSISDFRALLNKEVLYNLSYDNRGREHAVDIKII